MKAVNRFIDRYEKLIMLGLCIALAFVLGLAILQYQTNQATNHKITSVTQSAIIACKASKPSFTRLLLDLANEFQRKANNDYRIVQRTSKDSPLYQTRVSGLINDQDIVTVLHDYLPIRCVNRVNRITGKGTS